MKRSTFLSLLAFAPFALLTGCGTTDTPLAPDGDPLLRATPPAVASVPAIAFSWGASVGSGRSAANYESIAVMNADGQAATNVYVRSGAGTARNPTWGPTGSSISFIDHGSDYSIRIVDVTVSSSGVASGSLRSAAVASVANTSGIIADQAWSPSTTNSEIAYAVNSGTGTAQNGTLKVTTLAGTTSTLYTTSNGATIQSVAWSTDGSMIAFVEVPATAGNGGVIRTINRDGSNLQTVLTKTTGDFYWGLEYARGNDRLAFSWSTSGTIALHTLTLADGSVTSTPASGNVPTWGPSDAKIAYYGGSTAGIRLLTLSSGASATLLNTTNGGKVPMMPNWKR